MNRSTALQPPSHDVTRRAILVAAASVGVGGAAWIVRKPRPQAAASSIAHPPSVTVPGDLRALTAAEYRALSAASDRIYPRDETAGATDLGVPTFVDRALAGSPEPGWARGFRESLRRLDDVSRKAFGGLLCEVRPADQDAIIAQWAAEPDGDNPRFIRQLVEATLEGVFGDPIYGGNRGGRGWTDYGIRPDRYSPSRRTAP